MSMQDAIKNFNEQFGYEPEIENSDKFERFGKFIIAGMGGSNLVADLLKIRDPYIDIIVHRNYGLPALLHDEFRERLLIANSYSGNTEETIDSLEQAVKEGYPSAVIASGGKLIERAKKLTLPFIQIPATGIQPRSALGYNLKAVLKMMGREDWMNEAAKLKDVLNPSEYESAGRELAQKLKGRVPLIYSSERNFGIAYNWKIKFNETGKIPAYYNVFPELNHNEMTGFDYAGFSSLLGGEVKRGGDASDITPPLPSPSRIGNFGAVFHFIFLKDPEDHPKIQKRMEITEKLYRERGLPVETLDLAQISKNPLHPPFDKGGSRGISVFHKIFSWLVLADWTAYYTAAQYGFEAEKVPMVETFKRLME